MRRGKIDIIENILEILKSGGSSKTKIVYGANLNFKRAERYLFLLHRMGLITNSTKIYYITMSGREYLEKVNEIKSVFGDETI